MYQPIPRCDLAQNRLAFPVLAECGNGVWALYAEAAVFGDYGGSTLLSDEEKPELLMVRRAPDQLSPTQTGFPLVTPWRVVMCGSLDDIVSSNLLENLNPPCEIKDTSFIRPGVSAWSWKRLDPRPRTLPRICRLCGGDGIPVLSGRRRLAGICGHCRAGEVRRGQGREDLAVGAQQGYSLARNRGRKVQALVVLGRGRR